MLKENIAVNAQTFAAMFECVERSKVEDKNSVLSYYRQIMQEKVNITLILHSRRTWIAILTQND